MPVLPQPTEPATVQRVKLRVHGLYDLTIGGQQFGLARLVRVEMEIGEDEIAPPGLFGPGYDEAQLVFGRASETAEGDRSPVALPDRLKRFVLDVEAKHASVRFERVWVTHWESTSFSLFHWGRLEVTLQHDSR